MDIPDSPPATRPDHLPRTTLGFRYSREAVNFVNFVNFGLVPR